MKKLDNCTWEISNTVTEELGIERHDSPEGGYTVHSAMIHIGGQPHVRARNLAIAATYDTSGLESIVLAAAGLGHKASLVTISDDSGTVSLREGRLVGNQGKLALISKGSSTKGYYLERLHVLAFAAGYSMQAAIQHEWDLHAAKVPQVAKVTYDGIPEYDEELEQRLVHAVFLLDYPDFSGGRAPGCMFLATDVQPPEDGDRGIVNGFLWTPEDSELESEHGSQYCDAMERMGGRVTNFEPGKLTFADCWNLPTDREGAYRAVLEGSMANA